jgi:asparagine synthase (glutamine-hydrolysing)
MAPAEPAARLPKAFLAVSSAAGAALDPRGPGGELRVRAAAAMLTDACPVPAGGGDTRVWLAGPGPGDCWAGPGAAFSVLLARPRRGSPGAAELGGLLPDPRADPLAASPAAARVMTSLTPPFAVVCCAGPDRPVLAATDQLGHRHLYWCQGDGWAAMGTSSLALAYLASAGLDQEALAVYGQLGFHLGRATPFAGVHKLGPGGLCALAAGAVRLGQYACPGLPPPQAQSPHAGAPHAGAPHAGAPHARAPHARAPQALADLARSTAGLLRDVACDYLDEHPDLVLQLSGGLDSRIQLAAIPPARRAGIRAVTLEECGSPDSVIARQLALLDGLDHKMVALDGLARLDPAEAAQLVRRAAIRHDCSGNPVAHAVLDWAERGLDGGPRIHGMGGEVARGFYYPGQRQQAAADPALVDRLARWRLLTNEAVAAGCLGPALAGWARERALARLREIITGYGCDWLTATDEFYLRERLARWAGLRLTVAGTEQTLLGSLLHPGFVAQARACPPEGKRGSRFMAMVLAELDPGLARLPLESGYVPAALASAGAAARLQSQRVTRRKVASKVRQRLRRTGRHAAGAPALAAAVLAGWRREPGQLDAVAGTGLADPGWLSELLAGTGPADVATVGFLANLQVIAQTLGAPADTGEVAIT